MSWTLHSYWRATAPYRVRIGLNLKGLPFDYAPVDLVRMDQAGPAYAAISPQKLTPALATEDGVLIQSLAILEWLEEVRPEPPLLPGDYLSRQRVRAMAGVVACDIHPLNNARVLRALAELGLDEEARNAWAGRWITAGFDTLERLVAAHGRGWSYGDEPGLADCCLVPQLYSAARFGVEMSAYPRLAAVGARAAEHPAFLAAHPDRQPDAPAAA